MRVLIVVRATFEEQPQVPFGDLLVMQDLLDSRLLDDLLEALDHRSRWHELLDVAGWTPDAYAEAIDRRWSSLTDSYRA